MYFISMNKGPGADKIFDLYGIGPYSRGRLFEEGRFKAYMAEN